MAREKPIEAAEHAFLTAQRTGQPFSRADNPDMQVRLHMNQGLREITRGLRALYLKLEEIEREIRRVKGGG